MDCAAAVIDPVLRIASNRAIFPGPIRPPDSRSMRIETWVSAIGKHPFVHPAYDQVLVSIALLIVAVAYAAVGQGGATGYIAVMGLAGLGSDIIRPSALALNMLVSAIGTLQFARAGRMSWRNFYPFALCALRAIRSRAQGGF